mmetsp:Transcript_10124/g.20713  ORF Transcript_10124/g.20713 Transcript_10124/m.20713 type:complete len:96 (-) Transcript_10124:888-1175(-)
MEAKGGGEACVGEETFCFFGEEEEEEEEGEEGGESASFVHAARIRAIRLLTSLACRRKAGMPERDERVEMESGRGGRDSRVRVTTAQVQLGVLDL